MPSTGTVSVRYWRLDVCRSRYKKLATHLSDEERQRADRFLNPAARRGYVVTRGMAREILAAQLGCEPQHLTLSTSPRGKPFISDPPSGLALSLSHASTFGALAFGHVRQLGVDIEPMSGSLVEVADLFLTPAEQQAVERALPGDKGAILARAWVAKEAYLKATGEGLAGGLTSLELVPSRDARIQTVSIRGSEQALKDWHFRGFEIAEGVVGAVVVESVSDLLFDVRAIDSALPAHAADV